MRVIVIGATGVLGIRLVPILVTDGHEVAGTTRTPEKARSIEAAGAEAIVADVYDTVAFTAAVTEFAPEVVVDLLTDLPDDPGEIRAMAAANSRIRREGTETVIAAFEEADATHLLVESVAWRLPGEGALAVDHLEQVTLKAEGVVLRYGQFYGPGTYHAGPPEPPRIHIDDAARRTARLVDAPTGVLVLVEDA